MEYVGRRGEEKQLRRWGCCRNLQQLQSAFTTYFTTACSLSAPLIPVRSQKSAAAIFMKILPPTNQPSWHEKRKRPVCPPCCLFPCKVPENIAKIASSRYMILHIDTSSTR